MKKQLLLITAALFFCNSFLFSQTNQLQDTTVFALDFSTYLSHTDKYASNFSIYTNSEGFTYISGNTRDKNFPATEGAYQTELKGSADAFVVKYSPEGEIVFATLLGGTKREHHSGITVDDEGYIYITGGTHSADFPVTSGSYDPSFNGEGEWAGDVFVTKLNPTGTDILFSTFLGGEIEDVVGSESIQVDSKGNIIIVGATKSYNFPLTTGSIDKNDNMHGFISKLSSNGEKLLFSTFYGNSQREYVSSATLDDKDNIYFIGATYAADLPVTENAFRKELIMPKSGGYMDHFIGRINSSNNKISYLSYFAHDSYASSSIKWTKPNRLIISGNTIAEDFPVTNNAISKKVMGSQDAYISIFNSETMALEYATLFGGSKDEFVMSLNMLDKDKIIIGGTTSSPDLPLTMNALYSEFPDCEKSFNTSFLGRKKSFVTVFDIKNSKLLYSSYFGASHIFRFHPDKNGNLSFVAEAGQKSEAGITGFPVTKGAIEPPSYTMVGRLLYNVKPKPTKEVLYKDVTVENSILETYVGKYELAPGTVLTIKKYDSQLKGQVTGQGEFSIFPKSNNEFFIKRSEIEISFNINDAGEVESLTVHPDGGDSTTAKKVAD